VISVLEYEMWHSLNVVKNSQNQFVEVPIFLVNIQANYTQVGNHFISLLQYLRLIWILHELTLTRKTPLVQPEICLDDTDK